MRLCKNMNMVDFTDIHTTRFTYIHVRVNIHFIHFACSFCLFNYYHRTKVSGNKKAIFCDLSTP